MRVALNSTKSAAIRPSTVPETIRLSLVTTTSPNVHAWSGKIRGNGSTSRPQSIRAPPRSA